MHELNILQKDLTYQYQPLSLWYINLIGFIERLISLSLCNLKGSVAANMAEYL